MSHLRLVKSQLFYATFGVGHEYYGHYVEIEADDHHAARLCMLKAHGERWSWIYTAKEFEGQVEKYRLRKLATVRQKQNDRMPDGSLIFIADRVA